MYVHTIKSLDVRSLEFAVVEIYTYADHAKVSYKTLPAQNNIIIASRVCFDMPNIILIVNEQGRTI